MSVSVTIRDLHEVTEDKENGLVFEKNVSVPLKASNLPVRCNVYRPIAPADTKFPVLITYGPYGKDIPYDNFFAKSFSEVNPEHKSKYSAWETPDPVFWTSKGYIVVRADERGLGQSPGLLDTMSRGTSECFFDVVEWAADQPWSTGKVGLLGISYYAGSQWRVAARRPKGLAAIIPWEGMTDYYRDRCRHGGIFSNSFIKFWWNRQVITNQYGRPGRAASKWGEDTIEGDLPDDVLAQNRNDQNTDNEKNRFLDDDYYSSKEFNLEDIEVPVLSVANWGGILLHLRGNVNGYAWAGSKLKYLRFITGRHDLPFYCKEEVKVQQSFLDAFLKDDDRVGWSVPGKVGPVSMILRKGDVGFNNPEAEKKYIRREESAWPIPKTKYTKFHLTPESTLESTSPTISSPNALSYDALGSLEKPQAIQFTSAPFEQDTEITGHVTAHLNVSITPDSLATSPEKEIDLFLTLRYISPSGEEVFYTGTAGDPVPLTKGWLRVSLRKVASEHPRNSPYQPYREYRSTDVQEVKSDTVYAVDVEIWPTNVVAEKGGRIVLEVSSGDTQGSGIFTHTSEIDRPKEKFSGKNNVHFGEGLENYVTLPIVPAR
ncbi:X-Pro dipeptidyl-peptidase protein-like protein [Cadophora sp. DSE1049]|nr:X-Pro dipeptidyl-peptidase protein-like protein [Cadophora sp. DSE1049]